MKRITTGVAILLFFCLLTNTFSFAKTNEMHGFYNMDDYAHDIVGGYIRMFENDDKNDYCLSQAFYISNSDECYAYFVLKGNTCIGMMNVVCADGGYTSSFTYTPLYEIDRMISEEREFCLFTDGEKLYANTRDNNQIIILDSCGSTTQISRRHATNLWDIKQIEAEMIEVPANSRSQYCTLSVPIVGNCISPDDEHTSLCWAAAMASIIRYRTGNTTLSALGEYNLLKTNYPPEEEGYPDGDCDWIERSFSQHWLSYTHVHSGTYYDNVKNIIEVQGRPIYCWLTRTGGAHSVVICGFESAYGYYYYRLVDSNLNSTVAVQVTNTSAYSFTYVSSYGYTYTGWNCHMY